MSGLPGIRPPKRARLVFLRYGLGPAAAPARRLKFLDTPAVIRMIQTTTQNQQRIYGLDLHVSQTASLEERQGSFRIEVVFRHSSCESRSS